jgi:hypothetical protein
MNYIFIYFLPGAGGNFFSRCVNLLDNSYCFVDANIPHIPKTLEEKIKLLTYHSQTNKSFEKRNWVNDFECLLAHYSKVQPHWDLPSNANSIWLSHPETPAQSNDIIGKDDRAFNFIIDSSDAFEWTIINALYKNSYLDVKWFVMMEKFKQNRNCHKINLKNILNDKQGFFEEFNKVCAVLGHTISLEESCAVGDLYDQWQQTVLKSQDIAEFKRKIGFLM